MPTFWNDLKYAVRMFSQKPGFSLVAISALALGVGGTTAVFSVVDQILLKPLPFREPERLVRLTLKFPNGNSQTVSIPKFTAWKANTSAFQYACAYDQSGPGLNMSGDGVPVLVKGVHASADFFPVFGVDAALGRVFSMEEDRPGGPRLAVLSDGIWNRRFGGDRAIIGRSVVLSGELYTVIGVLPASFHSYPPADFYLPLQMEPNSRNQGHYLSAAARLKAGETLEAANAQMKIAAERFRQSTPGAMGKDETAGAVPFEESMVGDIKQPLFILLGAVALVLLIACANVANLLLARATDRSREMAIRTALGAARGRIVRQLLTESLVLSLAGGAAGLLAGVWGAKMLVALSPAKLPRAAELHEAALLDWRVLVFTMAVAVFTGIAFGLFPALQISRTDVSSTIKEGGSRSGSGRRNWGRNALVVTEVALALVLLVGAGLLIRTFASLRQVNAGFNAQKVLSFETSLAGSKFHTTSQVEALTEDAERRIGQVPGVAAVANVPFLPLEGGFGLGFDIVGRALPEGARSTGGASWMYVSNAYFRVLEIPLRRGRVFQESDRRNAPQVVVINEAFAKKYWPKGEPIGERIVIGKVMGPDFAEEPREVVGIVGDVKEGGLGNPAPPVMYIPLAQLRDSFMTLNNKMIPMTWIVKTTVNPLTLSEPVKKQMQAAHGQLAVAHVRSLNEVVSEATARQDFNMTLLTVFSAIALVLAAIGVYGMLSYSVQQRSQEIGIRVALGAGRQDVMGMIVKQGMLLACLGILLGLAGAIGLARLLTALLFGVKPYDPMTFLAVAAVLALTALAACWIPARRATRLDPLVALRYE
jgi:putative ABC transport system permease protein